MRYKNSLGSHSTRSLMPWTLEIPFERPERPVAVLFVNVMSSFSSATVTLVRDLYCLLGHFVTASDRCKGLFC